MWRAAHGLDPSDIKALRDADGLIWIAGICTMAMSDHVVAV
jgi:hypothetical protein